jgi:hypothetical protein
MRVGNGHPDSAWSGGERDFDHSHCSRARHPPLPALCCWLSRHHAHRIAEFMKNDYQTDYRRDVIKVTAWRPPRWRLLDCTRKRYENHHASAGPGLARLRGHLFNVRAEKSGPGGKIAARFRVFRRLQQLAEAICVIFFADILPGQVAKTIKVKKRISRLVLNRVRINAELSF